jgi:hypothetical protein
MPQQPQGYPQQPGMPQQPQGYPQQPGMPQQQPAYGAAPGMQAGPSTAPPQMTPKAQGVPYEAWRQQGWTDQMLRTEGMML